MTFTPENAAWFAGTFARIVDNVGLALLGKAPVIRLAVTCLLAEGHLLLEDAPGTGKTALARALAATVQGTNSRIQFTRRDQPGLAQDPVGAARGHGRVACDRRWHQV